MKGAGPPLSSVSGYGAGPGHLPRERGNLMPFPSGWAFRPLKRRLSPE